MPPGTPTSMSASASQRVSAPVSSTPTTTRPRVRRRRGLPVEVSAYGATGRRAVRAIHRVRADDPLAPDGPPSDLVVQLEGVDALEHPDVGTAGPMVAMRTAGHTTRGFAFVAGHGIVPDRGHRRGVRRLGHDRGHCSVRARPRRSTAPCSSGPASTGEPAHAPTVSPGWCRRPCGQPGRSRLPPALSCANRRRRTHAGGDRAHRRARRVLDGDPVRERHVLPPSPDGLARGRRRDPHRRTARLAPEPHAASRNDRWRSSTAWAPRTP